MRHVIIPTDLQAEELKSPPPHWEKIHLSGETMGTNWSCHCYVPNSESALKIEEGFNALFTRIIFQMSNWDDTSWVSRFNKEQEGRLYPLPPDFKIVLEAALEIASLTKGAFNPCLGENVADLVFEMEPLERPIISKNQPEKEIWQELIKLDLSKGIYQTGDIMFDLSAIAKGYAVDQMGGVLEGLGIGSYLVEIGGEFRGKGVKPDGQPWWVSLGYKDGEHQEAEHQEAEHQEGSHQEEISEGKNPKANMVVALSGYATATSGNDHRYYRSEQGVNPHILAKKDSFKKDKTLNTVTVFDKSCMSADGWATALFALGVRLRKLQTTGANGDQDLSSQKASQEKASHQNISKAEDALSLANRLNIAAVFQFEGRDFLGTNAFLKMLE